MVTEFFGTFLFRLLSHVHENYSGFRENLKLQTESVIEIATWF